jgi:glycosyltransferase involved in cell wall biosynthesis
MMDIAFVNRFAGINRGGGEMWALNMAEGLEELGATVTFYVGKPLRSELPEPIEQFEYVEVPTPHLRDIAYEAPKGIGGMLADLDKQIFTKQTVRQLKKNNHDLIHINGHPQFARYVSEFDVPFSIKLNGPLHSLWYDYINPFGSSYTLLSYFDLIIATGITTEKIQQNISQEVYTINPGVDTDEFTPKGPTVDMGTPSILFVGRFVPAKNLTLLVEAFADVTEQFPSAELMLIGDGPLRNKIEERIRELRIQDQVRMPGYVDNADLPQYYRSADVFALSSRRENHPITLLESMSCETPVVAPNIGAISDIVDDGTNGLLYQSDDLGSLSKSLRQLLSDNSVRSQFGDIARKKVQDEYDWRHNSKKLNALFNRMIGNQYYN